MTLTLNTLPSLRRPLLIGGAAVVLVAQLAALAFVADGQVDRAKARQIAAVAQRDAMAQCMETRAEAQRSECPGQTMNIQTSIGQAVDQDTALLLTSHSPRPAARFNRVDSTNGFSIMRTSGDKSASSLPLAAWVQ